MGLFSVDLGFKICFFFSFTYKFPSKIFSVYHQSINQSNQSINPSIHPLQRNTKKRKKFLDLRLLLIIIIINFISPADLLIFHAQTTLPSISGSWWWHGINPKLCLYERFRLRFTPVLIYTHTVSLSLSLSLSLSSSLPELLPQQQKEKKRTEHNRTEQNRTEKEFPCCIKRFPCFFFFFFCSFN